MDQLPMSVASLLDSEAHDVTGLLIFLVLAAAAYAWFYLVPDKTVAPEQLHAALIDFHTPDLRLVPPPVDERDPHAHGPGFDLAGCDLCWAEWQDLLAREASR